MKKVLITGANGFIARNTARLLKEAGFSVIGTSSRSLPVTNFDDVLYGILGEPLKDVFKKHRIEVILHCAYDKNDIDNKKNAEGTLIWAEQAGENGVPLQIFISSLSADEDAAAPYGQKKYETEKWFLEHGHIVLRPGLVIGSGGLFRTIVSMVRKFPVIPLIDSGKTVAYVSEIDTVSMIIRDIVRDMETAERGRVWCIQQETPSFFGDILREISRQCGLFRIFVPIPYFVLSAVLSVGEKFRFAINTNNLKGMRQFNDKEYRSDLDHLGYPERPVKDLIKKALLFM